MKILLAIDGSPHSETVIEAIVGRPWPRDSELRIVSAVQLPPGISPESFAVPNDFYWSWEKSGRDRALAVVAKAAARIRAGEVTPVSLSTAVITGDAKEVILDEAARWGADLVVIGSHGQHGLRRFLLGSVSQAVASHATCSVEIVRGKKNLPGS
jgi:nucleotide-binding universal stress UspA family protein